MANLSYKQILSKNIDSTITTIVAGQFIYCTDTLESWYDYPTINQRFFTAQFKTFPTNTERLTLVTPSTKMVYYVKSTNTFWIYNGTIWLIVTTTDQIINIMIPFIELRPITITNPKTLKKYAPRTLAKYVYMSNGKSLDQAIGDGEIASSSIIVSDTEPEGIVEGRIWLDLSSDDSGIENGGSSSGGGSGIIISETQPEGIVENRLWLDLSYIPETINGSIIDGINAKFTEKVNTKKLTALQLNNTNLDAGLYTNSGDGLLNADGSLFRGSNLWWHVTVSKHFDSNGHGMQIATPLNNDNEYRYYRTSQGTTWIAWRKILDQRDYDILFQYANDGKVAIANAINAKGTYASSSDTFSTLALKISQISSGKKYASGLAPAGGVITITGLSFKPSTIIIKTASGGAGGGVSHGSYTSVINNPLSGKSVYITSPYRDDYDYELTGYYVDHYIHQYLTPDINDSGFSLPVWNRNSNGYQIAWVAYE